MANQIIIDIGAVANDGTGDPLRTAFGYVNDNFSNVWATGVANANIGFDGNKIVTVNTNGNLVLAPNGTGKVVANVDIVPNMANVRNLGALTNRWSTVYAQYLNIAGDTTFTGDLTVEGNLTVEGDTIQIGNITTDTKTIQLANTAANAASANGSGVTVGANDNIATMLYNSTSNTWVMNIGANITGNVTAPYFIGNGSQLTGITSYANANAVAYGQAGWAGNIIPSGNAVYSLGNATNQWNDLYVSNATIYMNNVPLSLTSGNVLTINGEAILSNDSNTNITTTGNIGADVGLFNDINLNNASQNKLLYTDEDRNIYDTSFSYYSGNNVISGSGNISAGTYNRSTWNQTVLTYDGTTVRSYLNTVAGTTTTGSRQAPWNYGYNNLYYGLMVGTTTNLGDGGYLAGRWAVFKVYNRALTAAEVTQNYNALKGRYGL